MEEEGDDSLDISLASQIMGQRESEEEEKEREEEDEEKNEEEGEAEAEQEDGAEGDKEEEDEEEEEITPFVRRRTDSYALAMYNPMQTRVHTLGRSESYHRATRGGFVDSVTVSRKGTKHLSLIDSSMGADMDMPSGPSKMDIQKLRIVNLLEHERANSKYIFPLIGAIPPSSLQHFSGHAVGTLRPSSSTSDYSSSTPMADDTPPQSSVRTGSPHGFEEQTASVSLSIERTEVMSSPEEQQKLEEKPLTDQSMPSSPPTSGQFLSLPEHTAAHKSSSLPPSFSDQPSDTAPQPQNTPNRDSTRRRSLTIIPSPPGTLERMATAPEMKKPEESSKGNGGRRRSDGAIQGAFLEDTHKPSRFKVPPLHSVEKGRGEREGREGVERGGGGREEGRREVGKREGEGKGNKQAFYW